MRPDRLNYTAITALLTAAAATGALFPIGPWFGVAAAAFYVVRLGWTVGQACFSTEPRLARVGFGSLAVVAALAAQGAIIYRLFDLGPSWTAGLTVLVGVEVAVAAAWRRRRVSFQRLGELLGSRLTTLRPASRRAPLPLRLASLGLTLLAAALLLGYFLRLDAWATDLAVRSPWDLLPDRFLGIVAIAVAALVAAALGGAAGVTILLPLATLAVMFTVLATRLYAVGYGFDPFIHQATESAILRDGLITPKPFYYLGQYALVTWLARVTDLGVRTIDLALVPAMFTSAVLAAVAALRRAQAWTVDHAVFASLVIFLLPLAGFTMTTPQGLADALFLTVAFLSLATLAGKFPTWPLWLIAAACATVHPLTGVPALVLAAAVTIARLERGKWRRWLTVALAILGTLGLPLLFIASSLMSGLGLGLTIAPLLDPIALWHSLVTAAPPVRLYDTLDFTYAWRAMQAPILLALAAVGVIAGRRHARPVWPLLLVAGLALADYVLLKSCFAFDFLAANERANYADRLWPIALFALAPLAAAGLGLVAARVRRAGALPAAVLAVVTIALLVSSLYLTYPRRDRHESSRGWSTSAADVEAVRLIATDAAAMPYVVLANQSTSAAALRELGFAGRYLKPADAALGTTAYLYPIPTGDALYQRFLAMNATHGARAEAEATMRAAGVQRLYYVVTFYWTDAGQIVPAAKREADQNWNLKNRNFVFRYDAQ
jgi:hypothetical protein